MSHQQESVNDKLHRCIGLVWIIVRFVKSEFIVATIITNDEMAAKSKQQFEAYA